MRSVKPPFDHACFVQARIGDHKTVQVAGPNTLGTGSDIFDLDGALAVGTGNASFDQSYNAVTFYFDDVQINAAQHVVGVGLGADRERPGMIVQYSMVMQLSPAPTFYYPVAAAADSVTHAGSGVYVLNNDKQVILLPESHSRGNGSCSAQGLLVSEHQNEGSDTKSMFFAFAISAQNAKHSGFITVQAARYDETIDVGWPTGPF